MHFKARFNRSVEAGYTLGFGAQLPTGVLCAIAYGGLRTLKLQKYTKAGPVNVSTFA